VRSKLRAFVVFGTAAFLALLLVRLLIARGGPYFEIPETPLDHTQPEAPLSRQAIVMSRRAATRMHPGASVTVIAPAQAPHYDFTHYLTVSGLLPRHVVRHPTLEPGEAWPDFVIALGAPLEHPGYLLLDTFPEGRLYARR
jgi:hypothetical protein